MQISLRLIISTAILALLASVAVAHDEVVKPGIPSEVPPWLITDGIKFELVDQTGKLVSATDFRGSYLLIYFGYTSCPDICPTTLTAMSSAIERLGDLEDRVQPLFITVDSVRDRPELLAQYVPSFHPRLVGLSGSKQQIFSAARHFGMRYYTGVIDEKFEASHMDNVYFTGPDGRLLSFFGPETGAKEMTATMQPLIRIE